MLVECSLESDANPTTIISLSRKSDLFSTHGKVRPGSASRLVTASLASRPVAVTNLLAAREMRPEPTQVVKPLELL